MNKNGKKWIAFDFSAGAENVAPNQVSKKRKPLPKPIFKKPLINFEKELAPQTVTDLAVHSRKVKEVEGWLEYNVVNRPKNKTRTSFLLITGPTGSGKTSTVKVLCNTFSLSISEWLNPVDLDFELFGGSNQVDKFADFLKGSKWTSLSTTNTKKIMLVEEFPNAIIRNPEELDGVLEQCFYNVDCSIIFICTDSFDNGQSVAQSLFPQSILNKYDINQISFNSCAASLLKNALKRANIFVQNHQNDFKTPSSTSIDAILATSMGDIRSAMKQYYFASLLGTSDLPTVLSENTIGTKRKRSAAISSVKFMTRDENLGLFHGLGRVLNPKRVADANRLTFSCDISKIIDEFDSTPSTFVAFLFENYLKYFGDVNDVYIASETLSTAQGFLANWSDKGDTRTFALWIAIMGLMISNEHKQSKWNAIKGPKKIIKTVDNCPEVSRSSPMDLFYHNIIKGVDNSAFSVK